MSFLKAMTKILMLDLDGVLIATSIPLENKE